MKKTKKLPIFLLLFALSGCDIVQNSNSENSQLNSNSIENSESSSSSEEIIQLDFTSLLVSV